MAIIVDKDGNVVTVENQPEEDRAMFPNIRDFGVGDVLINGISIVTENGNAVIPIASATQLGLILIGPSASGLELDSGNFLKIVPATAQLIKNGNDQRRPIVPYSQHAASFYGMAKAAGDTTQSQSANEVGNYTDDAKIAIRKMLGLPAYTEMELINDITIDEASPGVSILTDLANASFKLRKAKLIAFYPQSTIGSNSYLSVRCVDADSSEQFYFGNQQLQADSACVVTYEYEGFGVCFDIGSFRCGTLGATSATNIRVAYDMPSSSINAVIIEKNSASATDIPAGTRFKLYGIREV